MLYNPTHYEKTKHIDIDCHFVRHYVNSGFIKPSYVPSSAQLAYVFTKPLGPSGFKHIIVKLNMLISHVKFEGGELKTKVTTTSSTPTLVSGDEHNRDEELISAIKPQDHSCFRLINKTR